MEPKPTKERTLEVEIERLLPGGVGLAHAEGLTLFVSLAAPGDVVRVNIDRVQGKVGFATIVEVLKPSPVRVEPPCPYFGLCGGCDFQQLTYEAQLNAKVEIIRDCLHRIGRLEIPDEIPIVRSPSEWHYRARALWQVDGPDRKLGYFARGSRDVCDVEYCAVLVPELEETLEAVRREVRDHPETPSLKDISVVAGDEGVSVAPSITNFEPREVSRKTGEHAYHFNAEAFFQINHQLLPELVSAAIGDATGNLTIDLYCGVGLFTLPLSDRFAQVIGVEANERAAKFARKNVESNGTQIVTARVGDWLNEHAHSLGAVDFLLLDPPRTGCENKNIAGILALRPARISYVSCDPATLARDLKKLVAGGYSLYSVVAFDMFPQTHHVETVAHLSYTSHA